MRLDSWEQALSDAMGPVLRKPIPAGWFTVRDEQHRTGTGYDAASKRVADRWRRGLLERKPWPNPAGNGSPCYIYRPVRPK